ncbi:phage baseplate protein [Deinococcus sp. HMF7620]|uniref:Phage baseplate protein n=1 Tax=Deinococcus arboris TaxID=2682977 RepID=A0A7C9HPR5_9DEIO|nr:MULTISPECIES: GPW/gp25 family protein [Deinococcus]MBZ9751577.1 GPW/gp25 family protein [Deinococcus betulae]MVN85674.1 phage baseplate protein [Deinococcus arboris]
MTKSSLALQNTDVLGTGVAFPVSMNARGQLSMISGERAVTQAILTLLMTARGQRVMRPEYGCRIHELVFAPGDATTLGLASYYVDEALRTWEPRIEVENVQARLDPSDSARIIIELIYRFKGIPEPRSLVFPFYRTP